MYSNNRVKIRKPPEQTVEYVVNWNHFNQLEIIKILEKIEIHHSPDLRRLHGCGVDNPSGKYSQSESPGEHEYYEAQVTQSLEYFI